MNLKNVTTAFSLLLFFTFGCETKPPPDITDPGQLLYLGFTNKEINCGRCHGPEGAGGSEAPDIRRVFSKFGKKRVVEIIRDGKGDDDDMPAFKDKIGEQELNSLLKFLSLIQVDSLTSR